MKTRRLRKAYYSSVSSAFYQLASIICGLILPKIILDAYGSVLNGVVSSITQFFSFFSVLQAGVQGATRVALYKTLANDDKNGTDAIMSANVRYYRKLSYILIVYILVLSFIFPVMIHDEISKIDIMLLVLIIGLSNFVQYFFGNAYKALISADQSIYILNIFQTSTLVLNTIVSIIIVKFGGSVIIAKLGSGIIYALNPIVMYIYVTKKYHIDKTVTPNTTALNKRWDVLANSFANIVHENVDIIFITVFCSAVEVSIYTVYSLISNGLSRLMLVFTDGMEAAFGDMIAKNEKSSLKGNFDNYEFMLLFITSILASCMVCLTIPFITLYTRGVNDANYLRPFLAICVSFSFLLYCLRMPYITLVQAAGKYKETKVGSYVEAGINILLTAVLLQLLGIEGAIVGTAFANAFRSIQYGFFSYKHILHDSPLNMFKRFLWVFVSFCCCSIIGHKIIDNYVLYNWLGWVVQGSICFGVSVLITIGFSVLFYRASFEGMIKTFLRIFTKR